MKSMTVLFLSLCAFAFSAFGAETITVNKKTQFHGQSYEMRFGVNPALNRAWVEVREKSGSQYRPTLNTTPYLVEGLSYNDGEIIYTSKSGVETVCANVAKRGRWIFKYDDIQMSGNCELEVENTVESYDDGFYIQNRKVSYFNLVIL